MHSDPALAAYEVFATAYNHFNHTNDYEKWLGAALLPALQEHGLPATGNALDVGCGTGRAFRPLLKRGWKVKGCDLSPAMLELAAEEGNEEVPLIVADMRDLPDLGSFDLVLSLNDSVNCLLGDGDLVLALSNMRRNLADCGRLLFDVNSRSTFASEYSERREVRHKNSQWIWKGAGEVAPSIFEAEIGGDGLSQPVRHLERFRPEGEVRDALRTAGFETLAALGMSERDDEILLSPNPDESRDYKL
ncbi:MAG TPA: class I SAM-dependent methyltransferase, partial [Terrimicrobiaceae bacterium]|nr:class I SAM-dependent methyltransferase [Terrimicrobiaceae bacterium]